MTPTTWVAVALTPALSLLPPSMDSPQARAMLLAIALQESGLRHRRQVKGPARGYYQFELGGVMGVLQHHATRPLLAPVLVALDYPEHTVELHAALEHNDVLATVFARLLLYSLPFKLPSDANEGWSQYVAAWRPGKPHPERWPACWNAATDAVVPNRRLA